jgi:hypothetical protein
VKPQWVVNYAGMKIINSHPARLALVRVSHISQQGVDVQRCYSSCIKAGSSVWLRPSRAFFILPPIATGLRLGLRFWQAPRKVKVFLTPPMVTCMVSSVKYYRVMSRHSRSLTRQAVSEGFRESDPNPGSRLIPSSRPYLPNGPATHPGCAEI